MERDDEIRALTQAFLGYRELLIPLQENLHAFADSYDSVKTSLSQLNSSFEGDIQGKLSAIMSNLQSQASKAGDLSNRIEQFVNTTNRYTAQIDKILKLFADAESKITSVNEVEARAEEVLDKIEAIAEEKKKSYNLSQLQRSLEGYNSNLQSVSEFINKDVAKVMGENTKKLDAIKTGTDSIEKKMRDNDGSIRELLETYTATNGFLKKITEHNDVDESYLFDVLDRWAESRRVKIKK